MASKQVHKDAIIFATSLEIDTCELHLEWLGHDTKMTENMILELVFGLIHTCWYYANYEINKDDLEDNHMSRRGIQMHEMGCNVKHALWWSPREENVSYQDLMTGKVFSL